MTRIAGGGSLLVSSLLLAAACPKAMADRISDMTREERCVYTAKLQVAAAWYYAQGRSRDALTIHWHGDETPNEIAFVNRTIDAGYEAMRQASVEGRTPPGVEVIGDRAYVACMKESAL